MNPIAPKKLQAVKDAAQLCRDAAEQTMGERLRYDEESILLLDSLISRGWKDGSTDRQITELWGAFLGEAMCAVLGGQWVETEAGLGVAFGTFVSHPFNKIEKRFEFGSSESVAFFYKATKMHVPSPPRKKWWQF